MGQKPVSAAALQIRMTVFKATSMSSCLQEDTGAAIALKSNAFCSIETANNEGKEEVQTVLSTLLSPSQS